MVQQKHPENNISYFTPQHGKTESHIRVPESYKLHVCPSACGRRFAIHALSNRQKDTVSCLYITEGDVVSGHYEDMIGDAVGELLAELSPKPKVVLIYVNCIDDFLGTDEPALLKRLHAQYPFLRFTVCHVDPIALDGRIKPGEKLHNQIYSLLDYTGKKDKGINMISNFAPIDAESELFRVLSGWGKYEVRQLSDRKTFAEFLQMADSRLNLLMTPMGKFAVQSMAEKLDIPYLTKMVPYDMDEIVQVYQDMAAILGERTPDFGPEIEQTRQAVQKTLEHVGNMPVIVDSSASCRPFGMAKALCRYGFNVQAVFYIRMYDQDWEDRKWLESHFPKVSLVRSQNYELIMNTPFGKECIAIGFDCGYMIHAAHFVDMLHDETFFGFQGVRKLMRLIWGAYDTTADWERIKEKDEEMKRL
jgi:nitrogenase molybdenum-iron protein alpha/beta subunit